MGVFDSDDEWSFENNFNSHSSSFDNNFHSHHPKLHSGFRMEWWFAVGVTIVGIVVLVVLIARCCCYSGSRGRVIAPPVNTSGPAPYPQQQYAAPYIAAVPGVQATGGGYYPPTQYVPHAPVVATGTAQAPYPHQYYLYAAAPTVTPYPVTNTMSSAPYPTHEQFPMPQPAVATDSYTGVAPPGWGAQACPPSYDQVMGAKQPPYNPHMPH